jgi:photosystem II stability/assembly factor-like uncharacterized protein
VPTFMVATERALLIVRRGSRWRVEEYLTDKAPESLGADPHDPARLYCGTWGAGLWRSRDAGRHWDAVGGGVIEGAVTAVAASPTEAGVVYAGTEPSAVFRSDDRGDTWRELAGLRSLPSSRSWSFPPRPDTHHVRWIEIDPVVPGRVFVAIEAGALVRTADGGRTWLDRVRGGPLDTHTAATHAMAAGRLYSAAGDGYFESGDAGDTWSRFVDGLRHRYMVGIAVDPGDPDTVIISGASGPFVAYEPARAEACIYRKTAGRSFEPAMEGLPDAHGTVAARLATQRGERGAIYAATNHGIFRTGDAGRTWTALEIPWPPQAFAHGVDAFACVPD